MLLKFINRIQLAHSASVERPESKVTARNKCAEKSPLLRPTTIRKYVVVASERWTWMYVSICSHCKLPLHTQVYHFRSMVVDHQ